MKYKGFSSSDELIKQRDELLKKISNDKRSVKGENETVFEANSRLVNEIDKLEEENHNLRKEIKDLELKFIEKQKQAAAVNDELENEKGNLANIRAQERAIINELEFYDSEKQRLNTEFLKISNTLDSRLSSLNSLVSKIEFIKGEINTLIEKMSLLENDVPEKYYDVDNIDILFSQTIKDLQQLHVRTLNMEKKLKIDFYKRKY